MADLQIVDSAPLPPAGGPLSIVKSEQTGPSTGDVLNAAAKGFFSGLDPRNLAGLRHPIDTAAAIWKMGAPQREEATKLYNKGEYAAALERAVPGYIPLLGPLSDTALNDPDPLRSAHAVGQLLSMKAVPEIAKAVPKVAAALPDAVAAVPAAVDTATRVTKAAAAAGGKDVLVGGAKTAAGAALAKAGPLGEIGDVVAGLPLIKSGVKQMGKGARAGFTAGREAYRTPPAEPVAAPEAAAAAPKQLGAGAIVPPAPADTSGVIPGWQPTILEHEPPEAAAAAETSANPAATAAAQPTTTAPAGTVGLTPGQGTHLNLELEPGQVPKAKDYAAQARKVWAGHMATRLKATGITADDFGQMTQRQVDAVAKDIGINPSSPEKMALVMDRLQADAPAAAAAPKASKAPSKAPTPIRKPSTAEKIGSQLMGD